MAILHRKTTSTVGVHPLLHAVVDVIAVADGGRERVIPGIARHRIIAPAAGQDVIAAATTQSAAIPGQRGVARATDHVCDVADHRTGHRAELGGGVSAEVHAHAGAGGGIAQCIRATGQVGRDVLNVEKGSPPCVQWK